MADEKQKQAPEGDENYVTKAMQYMIDRKKIMRKVVKLDPVRDREQYAKLMKQADDLFDKAEKAGGLSGDEAQTLAWVH